MFNLSVFRKSRLATYGNRSLKYFSNTKLTINSIDHQHNNKNTDRLIFIPLFIDEKNKEKTLDNLRMQFKSNKMTEDMFKTGEHLIKNDVLLHNSMICNTQYASENVLEHVAYGKLDAMKIGAGTQKGFNNLYAEVGQHIGEILKKYPKIRNVDLLACNSIPNHTNSLYYEHMLYGIYDSVYKDERYKQKTREMDNNEDVLININIPVPFPHPDPNYLKTDIGMNLDDRTYIINRAIEFAKGLVNTPSNLKTPSVMAAIIKQFSNELGLNCKVLGKSECEAWNMGAYLGVQQGSAHDPAFVHVSYIPESHSEKPKKRIVLVGKGLTFDSGGYNLKVGNSSIEMMKMDMGGAAAVFGAAQAIAQLKPENVEVHFISAICENMISSQAMRPGDILTASNGKTIEVINTDAEGRLSLADALVYATCLLTEEDRHQDKEDVIIDLATLTGACVVALGEKYSAVFTNNENLLENLQQASKQSNDLLWPLPLAEEYQPMIEGKISNIKNLGTGADGAGSITAALFLQEFVGANNCKFINGKSPEVSISKNIQWAHIDMAGPVWNSKTNYGTGWGVKLLTTFVMSENEKLK